MEPNPNYDLLVVTGPTASGKTSLAVAVAHKLAGEVISADSRQVYRGMDIGTGKDYADYMIDGVRIPCHLIDVADPGYKYNVFEYQRDFHKVYTSLKSRNVFPVVCGGSGMYADSIITGYKMFEVPPDSGLRVELEKKSMEELRAILSTYKNLHNTTDLDTKKRVIRAIEIEHFSRNGKNQKSEFPKISSIVVGVMFDREIRRKRITDRLKQRFKEGMIDEVKRLVDRGITHETLIYYGLEYKYITLYLMGELTYDEMFSDLETAIHQYAKRQMTWFRGMERRGIKINWIDGNMPMDEKIGKVMELLYK
ncbi:MAG TPA: tRNA (adenosine(37)-N6)-dimethylallyltransferase MiaA [Bacteroidales bacterium]|nr:tRNA (adenosine(37)-N6)-dimethylallyltransferase MiaA [Bacteroidales bacterium]HPT21056.1 tRNA (adenosine(37)-N6)-dimethylallyltransferase MiaA [Bacteroidales bacterium]